MEPLIEYPNLFANGKFKVRFDVNVDYEIREGSVWKLNADKLQVIESKITSPCTLIARPIEDMTGEEVDQFLFPAHRGEGNYTEVKQDLVKRASEDTLSFGQIRKMLKIGVYPFDHSHFETGTVININEI